MCYGISTEFFVSIERLEQKDFSDMAALYKKAQGFFTDGLEVHAENEPPILLQNIDNFFELVLNKGRVGYNIQRYKGLGEMNADQLWETTMDPSGRRLLKISIEDAVESDRIFSVLMGDSVDPRKNFIIENALQVDNLDI